MAASGSNDGGAGRPDLDRLMAEAAARVRVERARNLVIAILFLALVVVTYRDTEFSLTDLITKSHNMDRILAGFLHPDWSLVQPGGSGFREGRIPHFALETLSIAVLATLRGTSVAAHAAEVAPVAVGQADPYGEDLQLALYCCYELHYRGFAGVSDDLEWDPGLLGTRRRLEQAFLTALRDDVAGGTDVAAELAGVGEPEAGEAAQCKWHRGPDRRRRARSRHAARQHGELAPDASPRPGPQRRQDVDGRAPGVEIERVRQDRRLILDEVRRQQE